MRTENNKQADNDYSGPYLSRPRSEQPTGHIQIDGHENGKKHVQNPVYGCEADTDKHHFIGEADTKSAGGSQFDSPCIFSMLAYIKEHETCGSDKMPGRACLRACEF